MSVTEMRRQPAEVFPPGEFIKEELEARGWTQSDLAEILGRPFRVVNEIVGAKRAITPETAQGLADAFGTSPNYWMNLESSYQLGRLKFRDESVARRASLYAKAPVKEMARRNWIEHSHNVDVLEQRVLDFFGIKALDETPQFLPHAARKSSSYDECSIHQCAWLIRARQLARSVAAGSFSPGSVKHALDALRALLLSAEEVRHAPRVLAEFGIRMVVVEALAGSRIDGATFWLDAKSPVIALSLRYDRVDWFWHTLLHEMDHIAHGEGRTGYIIDTDLVGDRAIRREEKPIQERRADEFASGFSVAPSELASFVLRVRPLYSKVKIKGFAARIGVHPGIVVGQLQYRGEIGYSHSREMLVRVRQIVTQAALTDGWGQPAPKEADSR